MEESLLGQGLTVGKPQFGQVREDNALDRIRQIMAMIAMSGGGLGMLAPRMGVARPMQPTVPPSQADMMFQSGRASWPALAAVAGTTGAGGYGAYQVNEMMAERNRRLQEILNQAR